ncbi:hypothetical protein ACP70R_001316 [Stipagrostis hirtigluma subsp. patula]
MAPSDECSWLLYLSRAGRCGGDGDGEPHHRDLALFAAAFLAAFVVPALLLLGRYWWTRRGDPLGIAGAIPGPRELPVVGSMVLMAGLAHRNLAKVAAAAGRLARRRLMAPFLGETRIIVNADPDVARELPAGAALADRLLFHRAIGFAPHVVWRALRRVASSHLFPPRQVAASASEHAVIAGQMVPAMAREAGGGATAVVARGHLKRASLHNVMWSVFSRGYDDNRLPPANAVVAADGSGDYTSISAAIAAAPRMSANRYVIHVKEGVYKEFVTISKDIWNLTLVGDGMDKTVISGSRCCADGYHTAETAIVSVYGNGFIARELAIENTAGPRIDSGQAVALMSVSDCSVVYHCALRSFQDTLFARQKKQFYRECHIAGTVDFVFGAASAVFQKCTILARLPLPGQQNTITAQGRDSSTNNSGFVFQRCTVVADDDLSHAHAAVETYLGRPWKAFSRTIFMQSTISNVIDPKGWLPWEHTVPSDTIYYAEYSNDGPGADVSGRVDWHSFHVIHDAAEADAFTVARFIKGNDWLPSTGVDYTPGL